MDTRGVCWLVLYSLYLILIWPPIWHHVAYLSRSPPQLQLCERLLVLTNFFLLNILDLLLTLVIRILASLAGCTCSCRTGSRPAGGSHASEWKFLMIHGDLKQISILIITITDLVTTFKTRVGICAEKQRSSHLHSVAYNLLWKVMRLFIPASVYFVHGQTCGWHTLDKSAGGLRVPLFWPMRAEQYNQTDLCQPITGLIFYCYSKNREGLSRCLGKSHVWRQHTA